MPAKKMRVEVFDETGNRYTITFEGRVTREKAVRLLDIVELLGGMPGSSDWDELPSKLSKVDKIRQIVERQFPIVWFTSKEVQSVYQTEFGEAIGLSTVSTYLSRLTERGILFKNSVSSRKRYKLIIRATELNLSKNNV